VVSAKCKVGLVTLLLLAAQVMTSHAWAGSQETLAAAGVDMSAAAANQLEQKLLVKPDDLSSRIKLLGYYSGRNWDSGAGYVRQKHVLWVIEHHPESEIAGLRYAQLDPELDGEVYQKGKSIWLKHAKLKPKNATVLGNAAEFFMLNDEATAESLLVKAGSVDPKNPTWPKRLTQIYLGQMGEQLGPNRVKFAAKALVQQDKALKLATRGVDRLHLLPDAARAAYEAGDMKKAGSYAAELLSLADRFQSDPSYSDAVHVGNTVLGRVALKSGDLQKARDCLVASAKVQGSDQLVTLGPTMSLAKELLDKGEKDTVLKYLDLCGDFWMAGKKELAAWKKSIEAGERPDFAGSLN
jgi:hypothetical protein